MQTSIIIGRIKSMKATVVLDTGETIDINLSTKELLSAPGIDSIQTVGTIIGSLFGNPIEKWAMANPIRTQLHDDLENGLVELRDYTSISNQTEIELRKSDSWERVTYKYKTYSDASDELRYIKKKYLKSK